MYLLPSFYFPSFFNPSIFCFCFFISLLKMGRWYIFMGIFWLYTAIAFKMHSSSEYWCTCLLTGQPKYPDVLIMNFILWKKGIYVSMSLYVCNKGELLNSINGSTHSLSYFRNGHSSDTCRWWKAFHVFQSHFFFPSPPSNSIIDIIVFFHLRYSTSNFIWINPRNKKL